MATDRGAADSCRVLIICTSAVWLLICEGHITPTEWKNFMQVNNEHRRIQKAKAVPNNVL